MEFKSERLFMRPFQLRDKADTYEIYKDKETSRFLLHDGWDETNVDKAFQERLNNNTLTTDQALNLAVVCDNQVIGDLYVFYTGMKDTIEIGYTFLSTARGQGYATEAVKALMEELFKHHQVHRIQANLDARNQASAALCERLGMRCEAHFIQDYWSKGEWTDSLVYGMLAEEFYLNK